MIRVMSGFSVEPMMGSVYAQGALCNLGFGRNDPGGSSRGFYPFLVVVWLPVSLSRAIDRDLIIVLRGLTSMVILTC